MARPAWKILRVLGNLLNLPGFDYQSPEAIRDELKAQVELGLQAPAPAPSAPANAWEWAGVATESVAPIAMYQIDPVLRRSGALQRTLDGAAT